MRQSVGRLVRKALSFSKTVHFLQRHINLDDTIYNFVKPHRALRRRVRGASLRTQTNPAMTSVTPVQTLRKLVFLRG
jgi:hypothetical protein